jgi:hypothetical protein
VVEWAYKADQNDAGRVKGVDVEEGADQVKCVREVLSEERVVRMDVMGRTSKDMASGVSLASSSESEKAVDM